MKSVVTFILNLPFTLVAIIPLILSFPYDFKLVKNPLSFVFKVKSFWWGFNYLRYARAITISHIIFLGSRFLRNDLEHEIIHVKQFDKYPLIFPILYFYERFKNGYRKNRFEDEAYRLSKSTYVGR